MSATARNLEPESTTATEYATRGARRHARPQLRIVSPLRPERASRGIFALLVTGLLGVGLVAMLLINTQLAQGAFVVSELQQQKDQLSEQEAVLSEAVSAAAAPSALQQAASALGMIPSETPVFLRVPDGAVLGKPKAAKVGANAPAPRIPTPADATAAEAVDNAGAELPATLPADYDPAAADAAGADGAKASKGVTAPKGEDAMWAEVPVDLGDAGLDAVPVG